MVGGPQQVPSDSEEIPGDSVHGEESLRLSRRFEPPHLSLSLAGRLVGDSRTVVRVGSGVVENRRHHPSVGCSVAPQLVGDQAPALASLTLQELPEEALGRTSIATRLDEDVDRVAVLVHGTPELLPLPPDGHQEPVQVPGVAQAPLSPPERPGILGTELPTPLPDALVGDGDPPFCEEIFDIPEAQTETMLEPDGVADDLGWESVSAVAWRIRAHRPSLPAIGSS